MNLVAKLRAVPDSILSEVGHRDERNAHDVMVWDIVLEAADRIEALEKGYRILIKQWDSCSNMGYCPDLGYPIEDWCVYCIAQAALNKGKDQ